MSPESDPENAPITWKQVAMAGGVLTLVVSLVAWAVGVASHVSEHDRVLAEHAAAIQQMQRQFLDLQQTMEKQLAGIGTDQAVMKEKLGTVSETLARLDGRLTPSVLPASAVQPAPTSTARRR